MKQPSGIYAMAKKKGGGGQLTLDTCILRCLGETQGTGLQRVGMREVTAGTCMSTTDTYKALQGDRHVENKDGLPCVTRGQSSRSI